jgi:hypothetical protein
MPMQDRSAAIEGESATVRRRALLAPDARSRPVQRSLHLPTSRSVSSSAWTHVARLFHPRTSPPFAPPDFVDTQPSWRSV